MAETLVDEVAAVAMYPVKSCQQATVNGEVATELAVGITGFEVNGIRDRDFVLFDRDEGTFISQRGWGKDSQKPIHPGDRTLAAVQTDIQPDHLAITSAVGTLEVGAAFERGVPYSIDIFGKELSVVLAAPEASNYFSRLLGRSIWLMRSDHNDARVLSQQYQRSEAANVATAVDSQPFHLASHASLRQAHANNGMDVGIPINRYRANIIIDGSGLGAFNEDYIDPRMELRIGQVGAWITKACSRCPIPNIDQSTGEYDGSSLRVLRGRAGEIFTGEKGVFFGQHLVHRYEPGQTIAAGDRVEVSGLAEMPNISFRNAK